MVKHLPPSPLHPGPATWRFRVTGLNPLTLEVGGGVLSELLVSGLLREKWPAAGGPSTEGKTGFFTVTLFSVSNLSAHLSIVSVRGGGERHRRTWKDFLVDDMEKGFLLLFLFFHLPKHSGAWAHSGCWKLGVGRGVSGERVWRKETWSIRSRECLALLLCGFS